MKTVLDSTAAVNARDVQLRLLLAISSAKGADRRSLVDAAQCVAAGSGPLATAARAVLPAFGVAA